MGIGTHADKQTDMDIHTVIPGLNLALGPGPVKKITLRARATLCSCYKGLRRFVPMAIHASII